MLKITRDYIAQKIGRVSYLLMCLLCFVITSNVCNATTVDNLSNSKRLVILFTNDMHSNIDSLGGAYQREVSIGDNLTKIAGGFTRLATVVERQRAIYKEEGTALLLVDAGDMAMGTLFHSLYGTDAIELTSMANMGYDAFCLGNHDFDYGSNVTASMLISAKERAGELLPQLLSANISPKEGTELEQAFAFVGAKSATIIEKEGVRVGVIGSVSEAAYELMESKESINFFKPEEVLQQQVDSLKSLGAEYIILLSHGGTIGKRGNFYTSPDGVVADKVRGIDAIISGHDHDFLFEPLSVGGTYIGSSGSNVNYLGKMVLEGGELLSYELIPIDASVEVDGAMQSAVDSIQLKLNSNLYEMFGVRATDTLGVLNEPLDMALDSTGNMKLGALISESYAREMESVTYLDSVIGLSMYGTIRGGLAKGVVTVNDVFKLLSLGKGENDTPGSPLALMWLKGEEIEGLCEVVATISNYMVDATLFFYGVEFTYNSNRLPFTKVTNVKVFGEKLVKDKLYPIVAGVYTANFISLVKSESKGLISATLRDSYGEPLENIDEAVIPGGTPEWLAFSKFLKSSVVGEDYVEYKRSRIQENSTSIYFLYGGVLLLALMFILFIVKYIKKTPKRLL